MITLISFRVSLKLIADLWPQPLQRSTNSKCPTTRVSIKSSRLVPVARSCDPMFLKQACWLSADR